MTDFWNTIPFRFWKDRAVVSFLGVSLALNAVAWIIILLFIKASEDVVLHYNVYFGSDNVGSKNGLYVMPIIGLIVVLVNFILVSLALHKNQFAALILSVGTVLFQIILVMASIALMIVNR